MRLSSAMAQRSPSELRKIAQSLKANAEGPEDQHLTEREFSLLLSTLPMSARRLDTPSPSRGQGPCQRSAQLLTALRLLVNYIIYRTSEPEASPRTHPW